MPVKDLPDPEYLRQRFQYDPSTGRLFWRVHSSMPECWNARYAGREAGSPHNEGYTRVSLNGTRFLAHRLAWALHYGAWPLDQIDHINGDRADNRISNLRQANNTANSRNAGVGKRNTTGVIGVCWCKNRNKWQAAITVDRITRFLGYYTDKEAAIAARKRAEEKYGFHPNHGRLLPLTKSVAPATDRRPALAVDPVSEDFRDLLTTAN